MIRQTIATLALVLTIGGVASPAHAGHDWTRSVDTTATVVLPEAAREHGQASLYNKNLVSGGTPILAPVEDGTVSTTGVAWK